VTAKPQGGGAGVPKSTAQITQSPPTGALHKSLDLIGDCETFALTQVSKIGFGEFQFDTTGEFPQ